MNFKADPTRSVRRNLSWRRGCGAALETKYMQIIWKIQEILIVKTELGNGPVSLHYPFNPSTHVH